MSPPPFCPTSASSNHQLQPPTGHWHMHQILSDEAPTVSFTLSSPSCGFGWLVSWGIHKLFYNKASKTRQAEQLQQWCNASGPKFSSSTSAHVRLRLLGSCAPPKWQQEVTTWILKASMLRNPSRGRKRLKGACFFHLHIQGHGAGTSVL